VDRIKLKTLKLRQAHSIKIKVKTLRKCCQHKWLSCRVNQRISLFFKLCTPLSDDF